MFDFDMILERFISNWWYTYRFSKDPLLHAFEHNIFLAFIISLLIIPLRLSSVLFHAGIRVNFGFA
jgi:hypothetical protein